MTSQSKGIRNYNESAIKMWVLELLTCIAVGMMIQGIDGFQQKCKNWSLDGLHLLINTVIPEHQRQRQVSLQHFDQQDQTASGNYWLNHRTHFNKVETDGEIPDVQFCLHTHVYVLVHVCPLTYKHAYTCRKRKWNNSISLFTLINLLSIRNSVLFCAFSKENS